MSNFIQLNLDLVPLKTTLPDHSYSKKLQRQLYHKCWNCGIKIEKTISICLDCQMNMYLQQMSLEEFNKIEVMI